MPSLSTPPASTSNESSNFCHFQQNTITKHIFHSLHISAFHMHYLLGLLFQISWFLPRQQQEIQCLPFYCVPFHPHSPKSSFQEKWQLISFLPTWCMAFRAQDVATETKHRLNSCSVEYLFALYRGGIPNFQLLVTLIVLLVSGFLQCSN